MLLLTGVWRRVTFLTLLLEFDMLCFFSPLLVGQNLIFRNRNYIFGKVKTLSALTLCTEQQVCLYRTALPSPRWASLRPCTPSPPPREFPQVIPYQQIYSTYFTSLHFTCCLIHTSAIHKMCITCSRHICNDALLGQESTHHVKLHWVLAIPPSAAQNLL